MSISVVDFFDLGSLAEASYADFSNFSKMEDALLASGFSETQADVIVARWSVKAHLPNTSSFLSLLQAGLYNLCAALKCSTRVRYTIPFVKFVQR